MPPKRKATTARAAEKRAKSGNDETPSSVDSNGSSQTAANFDDGSVRKSDKGQSFNMKIVSWNVNGVRAALKNKAFDYLKAESCDILCLQETKCADKDFPAELKNWKEFPFKYYSISSQDGYAGVALFSKQKPLRVDCGLGIEEHDQEGRVITAVYENCIVVNAYVPNAGRGLKRLQYRMRFDDDFRAYLKRLDSERPLILCGDLNVAHKEIDLENPKTNAKTAGFTPEERANFTALLETGFVDSFRLLYPDQRRAYTFWSYMHNARAKNVGWRLDYFLASQRLAQDVCDCQIRSRVMGSDHCPIALYLGLQCAPVEK